jgi:hypothetical protein
MGRFTPIAGAETALTRESGKHVFEIAELLRVSHNLYNYRVWVVVCAVGYEPVFARVPPCSPLFPTFFRGKKLSFAIRRLNTLGSPLK